MTLPSKPAGGWSALRGHGGEPDELRKAGRPMSHEFLAAELAGRGPATRCSPRRPPTTRRGCPPTGSGSSTRWTAPGSSASGPHRLGGARGAVGAGERTAGAGRAARARGPHRRRGGPAGAGCGARHRARPPAAGRPAAAASWSAGPGPRCSCTGGRTSRRGLVPLGSAGAKVAAVLRATPTPTCTRAASTSGTRPPRSRSPAPPGSTPPGSTARELLQPGRPAAAGYPGLPARDRGPLLEAIRSARSASPAAVTDDGLAGGPSPPDTIPAPDASWMR